MRAKDGEAEDGCVLSVQGMEKKKLRIDETKNVI